MKVIAAAGTSKVKMLHRFKEFYTILKPFVVTVNVFFCFVLYTSFFFSTILLLFTGFFHGP